MLEEGISYPFKGDNALGRNVIGGVLAFLWFLVVPMFVVMGYLVRVIRDVAAGEEEPPEFEEWGELLLDGLKATIVAIVYSVVPFAVGLGILLFGLGIGSAAGDGGAGIVAGFGILGFLVLLLTSFVVQYVLPAALANFAVEENVGAAFDVDTIGALLVSSDYLVAYVLSIAINFMIQVLVFFLVATIVGIIVVPFVVPWLGFYAGVVVFKMFGEAYAETLTPDAGKNPDIDEHVA